MSINIENIIADGENLIVKYNYKYLDKIVDRKSGKDLGVKADGVSLEEIKGSESIENRELLRHYHTDLLFSF